LTVYSFVVLQAKRIVLRGKIAVPASVRAFSTQPRDIFTPLDQFEVRHVGSQGADKHEKLEKLGFNSIDELLDSAVPTAIRNLMDNALSETEALNKLKGIMSKRNVLKSKVQRFGVLMGFGGPRAGFLATTTAW
jgi:glycine cleavage system pyridoxal-binding protein P